MLVGLVFVDKDRGQVARKSFPETKLLLCLIVFFNLQTIVLTLYGMLGQILTSCMDLACGMLVFKQMILVGGKMH